MSEYSPLPREAWEICQALDAPPRLVAHLTLVHDVAAKLVLEIQSAFPNLHFDADCVLFGAATHDIGKAVFPKELIAPGHEHGTKGAELLRERGIPDRLSRFAYTHANWKDEPGILIEDLLVALADQCWKGKRVSELEAEAVRVVAERTGGQTWEVFATLDNILEALASKADQRLSWQAQFPANSNI